MNNIMLRVISAIWLILGMQIRWKWVRKWKIQKFTLSYSPFLPISFVSFAFFEHMWTWKVCPEELWDPPLCFDGGKNAFMLASCRQQSLSCVTVRAGFGAWQLLGIGCVGAWGQVGWHGRRAGKGAVRGHVVPGSARFCWRGLASSGHIVNKD